MAENTLAGYKRIGLEAGRPWRVETLMADRTAEAPGSVWGVCGGYVSGMCRILEEIWRFGGPGLRDPGPRGLRPGPAAWGRVPGTAAQGLGLLDPGASAARPANKVSTRQGRLASRPMRL